jgi:hypothetical protein
MINLGFDIDNVLTLSPKKLGEFINVFFGDKNIKIIIITGRPPKSSDETIEFLKNNKIYFDKIFFHPSDHTVPKLADWKSSICKKEKIDFMFESNPEIAQRIQEQNKEIICFVTLPELKSKEAKY